jgi:diguanylate cyclase (GGDEF)-like protein
VLWFWVLLAFLAGLAVTLLLYQQQRARQLALGHIALDEQAEKGYATLQARLDSYELLMHAVQSLYLTSSEVTPEAFDNLYGDLRLREMFPGLLALSYARRENRADGEHYIIERATPAQGNERLMGLDIRTRPPNFATLLRSRDDDRSVLSEPFQLMQLHGEDGVIMRLPVYRAGGTPRTVEARRERLTGSIGVSFRVADVIASAFPRQPQDRLHIVVSDISAGGQLPLYDSAPGQPLATSGYRFARQLAYGGRVWQIAMQSPPSPASSLDWTASVLPAGLLVSIMLALLMWSVMRTRHRAQELGWRMSRRYRESEERFRGLNELLGYQASHDELTDLYNRREFERQLQAVLEGLADGRPPCALLYIDLDQFKLINDTSGHAAGDQLLAQLAMKMHDQLAHGDVLARLGGDEFGVLALQVRDRAHAEHIAESMRQCIDGYVFLWDQRSYTISASIGGVMIDRPEITLQDLFAHADTACYLAKELGRNRVHFYSGQDGETVRRRSEMEWANRLRWAAEEQRLLLHYQEIWPLAAGVAKGPRIELLLRFRDDDGRIVVPGAFLPAAERYGLMPGIDRWVIETALANFDRLHPSGTSLQVATINLSGASVEDDALADLIIGLLGRHQVAPSRVCFEITETVAVRNLSKVARFMQRLRAIGCRVALDDFGAGMSSFGYLKNLPVDIIKIDGSFIRDMLSDPVSHAMVRAVTDIGHRLGLQVVAEWVTGEEIMQALRELGVDHAQGFALHMPEPVPFQRT